MAKKTVVRRLSKMLPLSSEIMSAVERDDDQFTLRNVTPAAAPASVIDPFLALPPAPKDEAPVVNLADMPEADWGDEKGGEA